MSENSLLRRDAVLADCWARRAEAGVEQETHPRDAAEQLAVYFGKYYRSLVRYLVQADFGDVDVEDLAQETFLRLYRVWAKGERVDNVQAWLFRVARNLAIDATRNRRRQATDRVDDGIWTRIKETLRDRQPTSEKVLIDRSEIQAAFSTLTSLQRECVHLRGEGLLYREIAEILDMSVCGVADAVRRAATKIRRRVGRLE